MKSVIVEIKDGFAAVLSDDGCVSKIKNNNYEIGQVIQMKNSKVSLKKKLIGFAASAAVFAMLGIGTWAYATPYAYISLDINPSIEYSINRFNRVLSVKALNEDGQEVINEVDLSNLLNLTIEDALAQTIEQIAELGYFVDQDELGVLITTYANDLRRAEELAEELQERVENVINDQIAEENEETTNETDTDETDADETIAVEKVVVETVVVEKDRVQRARELGVTPGKLNLVEKLQESFTDGTEIDIEEWLQKPVKEIMKARNENKKAEKLNKKTQPIEEASNDPAVNSDENATDQTSENANNQTDASSEGNSAEVAQEAAFNVLAQPIEENERSLVEKDRTKDAKEKANDKAKEEKDKTKEKSNQPKERANESAVEARERSTQIRETIIEVKEARANNNNQNKDNKLKQNNSNNSNKDNNSNNSNKNNNKK